MLSQALAVTHDATVGHWDPTLDTITDPKPPADLDDLSYLSGGRRMTILMGELCARFSVTQKAPGVSRIALDNVPFCEITRPSIAELKSQLTWVRNYSDLRVDRISEIAVQTVDVMSFYGSLAHLNASRRKKTLELLEIVQGLAITIEMQVKHQCWSPRPIDFASEVQPIIQTPDHSTFPSGHATEAYALATVLHHLQNPDATATEGIRSKDMCYRIAHRIAVNRTIAGVHFPVDSAAGAILGIMLGEVVIAMATDGNLPTASYGPGGIHLIETDADNKGDFTQAWLRKAYVPVMNGAAGDSTPLFKRFWQNAAKEW